MQLINNENLNKILSVEKSKMYTKEIKSILECAIYQQISDLTSGLLAYALLHDACSPSTVNEYNKNLNLNKNKYGYVGYNSNEILAKIMNNNIVISPDDLSKIKIRIYNNDVLLSQEDDINDQLKLVGSSLRIFVFGSEHILIHELRDLLGFKSLKGLIDVRYILGEIDTFSGTAFGPMYIFKNELSISPYMSNSAPAFCIDDRIVMRNSLMNEEQWLHAFHHESIHQSNYSQDRL